MLQDFSATVDKIEWFRNFGMEPEMCRHFCLYLNELLKNIYRFWVRTAKKKKSGPFSRWLMRKWSLAQDVQRRVIGPWSPENVKNGCIHVGVKKKKKAHRKYCSLSKEVLFFFLTCPGVHIEQLLADLVLFTRATHSTWRHFGLQTADVPAASGTLEDHSSTFAIISSESWKKYYWKIQCS